MSSKRTTKISEALNKQKVKALKMLVGAMNGEKYTPLQVSGARDILITLLYQGEE